MSAEKQFCCRSDLHVFYFVIQAAVLLRDNSELNTTARFSGYLNRIYFEEQPVRADAGSDVALAGVESGFRKLSGTDLSSTPESSGTLIYAILWL